jgi:catechol 2,3-dioxygenase-like lactoylglutathione lyase family enzyme
MRFRVEGLDHVALGVSDQAAEESWYRDVLSLGREYADEWGDTPVALTAGGSGLALFKAEGGEPRAALLHVAFRLDRENFYAAQEDFRERGISFDFENHGVAHSIYFEDPAGVRLELTTYEL